MFCSEPGSSTQNVIEREQSPSFPGQKGAFSHLLLRLVGTNYLSLSPRALEIHDDVEAHVSH